MQETSKSVEQYSSKHSDCAHNFAQAITFALGYFMHWLLQMTRMPFGDDGLHPEL